MSRAPITPRTRQLHVESSYPRWRDLSPADPADVPDWVDLTPAGSRQTSRNIEQTRTAADLTLRTLESGARYLQVEGEPLSYAEIVERQSRRV